jgi:hypothetical protein
MPGRVRRVSVLAALFLAAGPAGAAASEPIAWVVAGNASAGLDLPELCPGGPCAGAALPSAWPATSVAPGADSVAALPDGTLAVDPLSGPGLLRLGLDGRLRPWLVQREPAGAPAPLDAVAIDAGPDGSLLALVQRPDFDGADVLRVAPDGRATQVAEIPQGGGGVGPTDLAALPDGSAAVSDGTARVWRVRADGAVALAAGTGRQGFSGDGGPATSARLDQPRAVAAMPDGGFLIVDDENERVRRVAPDGTISTVLGDGRFRWPDARSWRDGAVAKRVDATGVGYAHAAPQGGFFFGHEDGGLFRVDATGRVRRPPGGDVQGPDGSSSSPTAVDVQADGSLALITSDLTQTQVRVLAPLEQMQRLVVSFTAANRRPVPRDEVEVVATRAARASIDVSARGRILARTEADLVAGLNRVPLAVRSSGDVRVLRVRAHAADDAAAAHRVAVIPGPRLSRRALLRTLAALARLRDDIEVSVVQRGCRRQGPRRFACRSIERVGPDRTVRRSTVVLRRDGLLRLTERNQNGQHFRWLLEPES